ncbi:hypothetical protein SASPL_140305 [Salvia splendens]|uniref:Glyoxal oxidase N-terminal domain-containing protein n=1 Tax=Salvia splendens TaxID=180675 RepID=A0A8X8ZCC8_SALSN|nr:hypothetical protein SASPL_140305 [Salvia splendens]
MPCAYGQCDWIELKQNLTVQRWYASDQISPDGRIIILGGRRAFSYEFFPKNEFTGVNVTVRFPFLKETTDPREENNLYPFLHLLPDGNLFVFGNRRSVLLDYNNNRMVREFPARRGRIRLPDPRIRVTDPDPKWEMEDMPMGADMLLLPSGDVIILNGAARGSAGWECASDPVLNPVMYRPDEPDPTRGFTVLNPTTIPRLYHSAATLLPDGSVLVGGEQPAREVQLHRRGVPYGAEPRGVRAAVSRRGVLAPPPFDPVDRGARRRSRIVRSAIRHQLRAGAVSGCGEVHRDNGGPLIHHALVRDESEAAHVVH